MKKVGTGLMFAFGLSVAIAAQTPQSTNPSGSTTGTAGQTAGQTRTASAAGQSVTVVGCLQRGGSGAATAGTTGTAGGATASAATGSGFMLTNVTPGGAATTSGAAGAPTGVGSTSSSSSGVTAPDGSGQVAMTYMLDGSATELTPHVGHRVEITGNVRSGSAAGASTGAGATAGGTSTGAAGAMAPRIDVTAVKMIAAACGVAR